MVERKTNNRILIGLAVLSLSSPAFADDEYRYRLTVVNRAGEDVSLVCNSSNPRPLALGKTHTLTFVGADRLAVNCTGYDHHGDAIAATEIELDHHHLVHTVTLRRGVNH